MEPNIEFEVVNPRGGVRLLAVVVAGAMILIGVYFITRVVVEPVGDGTFVQEGGALESIELSGYEAANSAEQLTGTLHLTLLNSAEFEDDPQVPGALLPLSLFQYRFAGGPLEKVADTEFHDTLSVREVDRAVAYVAPVPKVSYRDFPGYDALVPGVYFERGTGVTVFSEKQLPAGYIVDKRNPRIANTTDAVVYAGQLNETAYFPLPVTPPGNWHAFIADPGTGAERVLTHGTHPVFTADDQYVLVGREEGIYAVEVAAALEHPYVPATEPSELPAAEVTEARSGTLLIPAGEIPLQYGNQFQLSENGRYLSVNFFNPRTSDGAPHHRVEVYEIFTSSSQPSAAKVAEVQFRNSMVFWPTLSPEGRYLAVQVADGAERENPRVEVYDLTTGGIAAQISLSEFNFDYAFLTDWSYRE